MERVELIDGTAPVVIVAPHGPNDPNTDVMAEELASLLDAYAVINRGWVRAAVVDEPNDKANCNDVYHCRCDVVIDEFLLPLRRYVAEIQNSSFLRKEEFVYIFILHALSNSILKDIPDVEIVLGTGMSKTHPSPSCEKIRKDLLIHYMQEEGFRVYEGVDGAYSGKSKKNLNQLYRKWYPDPDVHSMQLEIIRSRRNTKKVARETAKYLSRCIESLLADSS